MNPELASLLAACKADPDDDPPRLVLADWLEEHGDSDRAREVRAGVAADQKPWRPGLAETPPSFPDFSHGLPQYSVESQLPFDDREIPLGAAGWRRDRVRGFLHLSIAYRPDELPTPDSVPLTPSWLQRFTTRLFGPPDDWIKEWAGPSGWPWVESVHVVRLNNPGAYALSRSPSLSHVAALRIGPDDWTGRAGRQTLGDEGARYLAESPYVGNLFWLDLSHNSIGPAGATALARSSQLEQLKYLNLRGNWYHSSGEAELALRTLRKRFGVNTWV